MSSGPRCRNENPRSAVSSCRLETPRSASTPSTGLNTHRRAASSIDSREIRLQQSHSVSPYPASRSRAIASACVSRSIPISRPVVSCRAISERVATQPDRRIHIRSARLHPQPAHSLFGQHRRVPCVQLKCPDSSSVFTSSSRDRAGLHVLEEPAHDSRFRDRSGTRYTSTSPFICAASRKIRAPECAPAHPAPPCFRNNSLSRRNLRFVGWCDESLASFSSTSCQCFIG